MLQDEHFFNTHRSMVLSMSLVMIICVIQASSQSLVCINLKDTSCQCRVNPPYNLLQNPSFESYSHCPSPQRTYFLDYNIIDSWKPGTITSSVGIYHNDKCFEDSAQLNFNWFIKRPFPDGAGFISISQNNSDTTPESRIYKDYISQCLQVPLKKNISYRFSFYVGFPSPRYKQGPAGAVASAIPFPVAVFGHANCSAIPFGAAYKPSGCPTNTSGWVLLGQTSVYGDTTGWSPGTIDLNIPYDINVIAIGPDCSKAPLYYNYDNLLVGPRFNYMDNFSLVETKDLNLQYISITNGNTCTGNLLLKAPVKPGVGYQWYKDSMLIAGATDSIYMVRDNGDNGHYNVRITNANTRTCVVSEPIPVYISKLSSLHWVSDTAVCSNQSITIAPAIPGIVYDWSGGTRDSIVKVNHSGIYNLTAIDSNGCSKSFTIQVRSKICSNCAVLFPNAFSPNGDGINDVFKPQNNCTADAYSLQIFNRSGVVIFETKDINSGWDGNSNGKPAPVGSYYYVVRYKNIDSQSDFINKGGIIILLR